jgi:ATP phosphoribosyltransferase regulatory subunit HisZ
VPRIEFEADTEEELLALAWRWAMGPQRQPSLAGGSAQAADQEDLRRRQLGEVLNAIRGTDSRRLLREVAERSTRNAALVLDADLAQRYGKRTGTAFAGIVAGPNKVMRRVARRDLISWDPDARGYRMDPADAEVVLERWPGS